MKKKTCLTKAVVVDVVLGSVAFTWVRWTEGERLDGEINSSILADLLVIHSLVMLSVVGGVRKWEKNKKVFLHDFLKSVQMHIYMCIYLCSTTFSKNVFHEGASM